MGGFKNVIEFESVSAIDVSFVNSDDIRTCLLTKNYFSQLIFTNLNDLTHVLSLHSKVMYFCMQILTTV